jgi:hypothetical protein
MEDEKKGSMSFTQYEPKERANRSMDNAKSKTHSGSMTGGVNSTLIEREKKQLEKIKLKQVTIPGNE